MTTHVTDIVANLKAALEAIDGTGSYKTSVTKVDYWTEPVVKIPLANLPWIGLRPIGVTTRDLPARRVRCDLQVALHCVVTAASYVACLSKLADLHADLLYAISLSSGRGGAAAYTTLTSFDFEEYTPDNHLASGVAILSIPYHLDRTAAQ